MTSTIQAHDIQTLSSIAEQLAQAHSERDSLQQEVDNYGNYQEYIKHLEETVKAWKERYKTLSIYQSHTADVAHNFKDKYQYISEQITIYENAFSDMINAFGRNDVDEVKLIIGRVSKQLQEVS